MYFYCFQCIFLAIVSVGTQASPYCSSPVSGGSSRGHSFPSIPKKFQTSVEANIIDVGYTMLATEYFDSVNNKGALKYVRDGNINILIFNYATSEMFQLTQTFSPSQNAPSYACVVSNLSSNVNTKFFGEQLVNNIPHIFTASAALRFGAQFNETYINQTTVRGISVDHWRACMYWPTSKANFTVDYYFSANNWVTEYIVQVPVRAEIKGVKLLKNGTLSPIHHIYDFFSWLPIIEDTSVFETPKGTYCPGRIKTRRIPNILGQFFYQQELLYPASKAVYLINTWFDSSFKFVRIDYRLNEAAPPANSINPISEVHDFNSGVAYVMDKITGKCQLMPIKSTTDFDVFQNSSSSFSKASFYVLRMKNPLQLFFIDQSYEYEGQRTVRGMVCDVFISKRTDYVVKSLGPMNTTLEYYILANSWFSVPNVGTKLTYAVPVMMEVKSLTGLFYHAIYNFFNFDKEDPDMSTFDVTQCYGSSSKLDFEVTLPIQDSVFFLNNQHLFMKNIHMKLSELAKVTPLRIQHSKLSYDSGYIYFIGTLIDDVPSMARFQRTAKNIQQYTNDKIKGNVSTVDSCAQLCTDETDFLCLSFFYCSSQGSCSLGKQRIYTGKVVPNNIACDFYERITNASMPSVSIAKAWESIKNGILSGSCTFNVVQSDGKKVMFTASDIRNDIINGANKELSSRTWLEMFHRVKNKVVSGHDNLVLSGVAADDCAEACYSEETFFCNSFDFCYMTGECRLSSLNPDGNPKLLVKTPNCDVYILDYTNYFIKSPGITVLSRTDVAYQQVGNPNQCATLCVYLDEFECKSFEYCDTMKACVLGRQHILDIPKSGIKMQPLCDHYSKKYTSDFKKISHKIIQLKHNQIVTGLTIEQCAKLCEETEEFQCKGFDYCGNKSECRLSDANLRSVGQVTFASSAYCDHFTRIYYPDDLAYPSKSAKPQKTYSPGSMAGLGISMLAIGITVSGLATHFWKKKRGSLSFNVKYDKECLSDE